MSDRIWSVLAANFSVSAWAKLIPDEDELTLSDLPQMLTEDIQSSDDLEDRLEDVFEWLDENEIDLDLDAGPPEKLKGGRGNDTLDLISWDTERVDGRKGDDLVRISDALWDSDLQVQGSKLVLVDRMTGSETILKRVEQIDIGGQVFEADALADAVRGGESPIIFADGLGRLKVNVSDPTPSVIWDQVAQSLVAETEPGPTNAARIYAMLHTAIYDAYAAHDASAVRVAIDLDGDNVEIREASADEIDAAMHHAGYTVLHTLFPQHREMLDRLMRDRLDLSPNDHDSAEARIGRDAAGDMLRLRLDEKDRLTDRKAADYSPVNTNPDDVKVIDAWTPEWRGNAPEQDVQTFLSPEFPLLEPFALPANADGSTDFDAIRPPAPEPFFMPDFADASLDIPEGSVTLAAAAVVGGVTYAAGDTVPVTRDLIGEVINPAFIAQSERLIEASANLTTQDRAVAEFWEDGPGTSYPPGTMMTLAQFVSERDGHDAATDAHLFLAMGNAMFDAAVAAWDSKVVYDYARPVQVIRDLGQLGLIGEPGVDELTGQEGNVIRAFAGYDPDTGASLGTRTILAENFVTYQNPEGDFSPPFAEYVSGHSTFSGAAAAVLESFTGDNDLGASTILPAGGSEFDPTFPDTPLVMSWPDFDSAAQDAGVSRIYGGIHFDDGNIAGLALGEEVGTLAAERAADFAAGTVDQQDAPFADWFIF